MLLCTEGKTLQRVLHKFTEDNFAKVERLVELYEKNLQRTKSCEQNILRLQKERDEIYEDYDPEDDEAEFDLLRLEAGLYALQMTCAIISLVFVLSEETIQRKLADQISLMGSDLLEVYRITSGSLFTLSAPSFLTNPYDILFFYFP